MEGKVSVHCDTCHAEFEEKCELQGHLGEKKKEGVHLCPFSSCKLTFRCASDFCLHLKTHNIPVVACKICGQVFQNEKTQYKRHISSHVNGKIYKCPHCKEQFIQFEDLQAHIERNHENIKTGAYPPETSKSDIRNESESETDSNLENILSCTGTGYGRKEGQNSKVHKRRCKRKSEEVDGITLDSKKVKHVDDIKHRSMKGPVPLVMPRQSSRLQGKTRMDFRAVASFKIDCHGKQQIPDKKRVGDRGIPDYHGKQQNPEKKRVRDRGIPDYHGKQQIPEKKKVIDRGKLLKREMSDGSMDYVQKDIVSKDVRKTLVKEADSIVSGNQAVPSLSLTSEAQTKIYTPKKRGRPCNSVKSVTKKLISSGDVISNDLNLSVSHSHTKQDMISKGNCSVNQREQRVGDNANDTKGKPENMEENPSGGEMSENLIFQPVVPQFTCDTCKAIFNQKVKLADHMRKLNHKQICKVCGAKLGFNAANMRRHMKIHSKSKPYVCKVCSKAFKRSDDLHVHHRTHSVKSFECKICSNSFFSRGNLLRHLSAHENNELFCPYCEQSVVGSKSLFDHVETNHKLEAQFACTVKGCGRRFCSNYRYINHLSSSHKQPGQNQCIESTKVMGVEPQNSQSAMHTPVREGKATNEAKIPLGMSQDTSCVEKDNIKNSEKHSADVETEDREEVNKKSSPSNVVNAENSEDSQNQLAEHALDSEDHRKSNESVQHIDSSLPLGKRKFACGVCDESFDTADLLFDHGDAHKDLWPKRLCYVCKKKVVAISMKCHIFQHFARGQFLCRVCKTEFPSRIERSVHRQSHMIATGQHPCPFKDCFKVMASISNLARHIRLHTETKDEVDGEYKCSFCPKTFICQEYLRTHVNRQHSNKNEDANDTFLCPVCGEYIKHLHNLKRHMKAHSEDKPHVCDICQKRFSRTDDRNIHMRSHLLLKLFTCKVCLKNFRTPRHYYKHMMTHSEQVHCGICGVLLDSVKSAERHHLLGCSKVIFDSHQKKMTRFRGKKRVSILSQTNVSSLGRENDPDPCQVTPDGSSGTPGSGETTQKTSLHQFDNCAIELVETTDLSETLGQECSSSGGTDVAQPQGGATLGDERKDVGEEGEFVHTGNLMTLVVTCEPEKTLPSNYVSLLQNPSASPAESSADTTNNSIMELTPVRKQVDMLAVGDIQGGRQGNIVGDIQEGRPGNIMGNIQGRPGNIVSDIQEGRPGNNPGNIQEGRPGNIVSDIQGGRPDNIMGNIPGQQVVPKVGEALGQCDGWREVSNPAVMEVDKEIVVVIPHTDTGSYICSMCNTVLEGTNTFITHMVQHNYAEDTEVEIDFSHV